MQPVSESDIATYVTADAVFRGAPSDESSMRAALAALSRDDALITCARINAIVSGFAPDRSLHERQTRAIQMLCSPEQMRALSEYAGKHGGPDRVVAFFRGQLLELARWVALYCQNQPGDGETFRDPAVRSAFVHAALIASDLWQRRLYGPEGIKRNVDADAQLRQLLGAFRKSVEEANQSAHAGFVISRGWLIYARYLPARLPGFDGSFQRGTGLTLAQYFISAFAILDRSFSDKPEEARIFATEYVQGETPFRETFARFIRLHSQTPEEWARTLSDRSGHDGYASLRKRPVFTFVRDRSVIFDPSFYLDNLASAPLFHVIAQGISSNAVFGAFGLAFEDYAFELLRRRFPSGSGILHERLGCRIPGATRTGQAFEVDAVINDVTALVVFEMKAAWLREETILASDPRVFLEEIRRKYGYVADGAERPKGIAQLARSVGSIARREWTGRGGEYAAASSLYPVLLVFDARMGAPGMGRFLNDEFRALLGPVPTGIFVHNLILMTVSDLEQLVFGVEGLSVQDFLRAYSSADADRTSSIHNFIATSDFLNQVRPSSELGELTEDMMRAARAEILPPE